MKTNVKKIGMQLKERSRDACRTSSGEHGIVSVSPDISGWCVCGFTCSYACTIQVGATPLMASAQTGHGRAVEVLIEAKAHVDIQHKVRFTNRLSGI